MSLRSLIDKLVANVAGFLKWQDIGTPKLRLGQEIHSLAEVQRLAAQVLNHYYLATERYGFRSPRSDPAHNSGFAALRETLLAMGLVRVC